MKLKRHFALAIALILMLGLFAGCGGDTANSAPSAAPSAPASDETPSAAPDSSASTSGAGLKIALSSQHLTNDFNRGILAGVEAKAAELGAELITANAQGDSNKQVSDIENFLTMDVDAVIIGGGEGPAFAPVMQKMAELGIPCITVDITSEYSPAT